MNSHNFFGEDLTPDVLGGRIQKAIDEAAEPYRGNKVLVAGTLRINPDTLDNYINGRTAVGAITMFRLAILTGKPITWFADGVDPAADANSLDAEIRRLLLSHKQQRVREIKEIDALLGL